MKRFTIKLIGILIPIYFVVLFYLFYIEPKFSNGLGWLGKIPFGKEYMNSLEKNYLKECRVDTFQVNSNSLQARIATCGDSFSQQNIFGYQNYLAHIENTTILNFKRNDNCSLSPEQIIINHLKLGDLHKLKTETVIVEAVERAFISNLCNLNFDSILVESEQTIKQSSKKPIIENISEWIRLSIWAGKESMVKKVNLDSYYFDNVKRGNELYFINADLWFTNINSEDIKLAKMNLIKLKQLFDSAGIKFIYLIAADKYNVYQSFTVNNPYPKNRLMEHFKDFDKMNYFMNTNNILIPMVENGIKDVYKIK